MAKARLKLYPFHAFLVVPLLVVFLYAHNAGHVRVHTTYRTLAVGMALTAVLFGAFHLIFRIRLKSGIMTTVTLLVFFLYGAVYEILERMYYAGNWPFANIHRYLFAACVAGLIAFFVFLLRSQRAFVRANLFLNALVILLLAFNLAKAFGGKSSDNREAAVLREQMKTVRLHPDSAKPNIYFIVLDGYASTLTLKKYYDSDNGPFMRTLRSLGFNVSDSAFANYYYTANSLCATLNMKLNGNSPAVVSLLHDNRVFATLRSHGYRVYHLFSGYAVTNWFQNADSTVHIGQPNEFEKAMLRYTILRLDDLVGVFAHRRLSGQFSKMHTLVSAGRSPKFVFMHFVAPHPPYVFRHDGSVRRGRGFSEHAWEPKALYLEQLRYVNTQIAGFLAFIVEKDPSATVILQSDHGPWISANRPEEVLEARSGVLYCWRSAKDLGIPRSTSPVNTFRYLFNRQFGAGMPLLPDSAAGKRSLLNDPLLLKKVEGDGSAH